MKKVIAYVHSHWDREWYRDFEEFRLRLIEVMDRIIENINSGEIPVFYFDGQTAAIEDYLEIFPDRKEIIEKLIYEKKLYIGPFYCSTDSFLTSLESMIRNIYFGIKKSKELGCSDYLGYLSDTFGHSPMICYILKSFGIDKVILWRGLGDLKADLKWEGIDTTYLIQGYFQDFLNLNIPIKKKAELLKKYLDKISAKSGDVVLLPIGADHLAPPEHLVSQVNELNKIYKNEYEIEIKTPFEYFRAVEDNSRKSVSGEFLDNSLNFILPGIYSSRIYLKQENARRQWELTRIAEPIQALSSFVYGNHSRQHHIDYAYKRLIKNHAHDSIYGCSIDSVHEEMMTRFEKVESLTNGVIKRSIRDLKVKNSGYSVLNLANFDFSGVVKIITSKKLDKKYNGVLVKTKKGFRDEKIYDINEIPITEDYKNIYEYLVDVKDIKAFSLQKIDENNICATTSIKTTPDSIENDFIKFEIENKKIVLRDKISDKRYKDFLKFSDRADIGDSYNFGALKSDKPIVSTLKSWKLKESNHIRAVLDIKFEMEIPKNSNCKGRNKKTLDHILDLNVIIYNQSKQIEFDLKYKNKSKNHILQIDFSLEKPIKETFSEDALGLVHRKFNPDYNIYDYVPAQRGIELKPNTAPMQRFVWTQGLGLVTEGLNEYEICKNTLKLTLLRATGLISNPKNSTRGTPAGPPLETPELQCIGDNNAKFALSFCKKPDELFKLSEEFYGAAIPIRTTRDNFQFLKLDNKNILVYALKLSEDALIVRLGNISEEKQTCKIKSDIKIKKIIEQNSLEEGLKSTKSIINFEPREIKTFKFLK